MDFKPETPKIDDERLGQLGVLANKQVALEAEVEEAEKALKQVKKSLAIVTERDIPELMAEIGLMTITTEEGKAISVKEIMTASISKARKPEAIKWLVEHDLSSIVSADVVASFGKGDSDAIALAQNLINQGYSVLMDEKVNTSSVKAAIKELLANGEEVPFDLFGVNLVKKSIVK